MCRDREFPVMLDSSVLIEHFAAATAALFSRAAGRRRYGREPAKWQPGRMVADRRSGATVARVERKQNPGTTW
jgi:hypothetical protein